MYDSVRNSAVARLSFRAPTTLRCRWGRVSRDPDETRSRRRVLALLLAGFLTLIGAGVGVSRPFDGRDADATADGVDLSIDYTVTPDERTPTTTPPPGLGRGADGTAAPPQRPAAGDGTDRPGRDSVSASTSARDGSGGSPARVSTATLSTPASDPVAVSTPPVSVTRVEPGDGGTVTLSMTLSGAPARLWARGVVTATDEGGTTEAERSAGDTTAAGELQTHVEVRLWYDADADGVVDGGERVAYEGPLADLNGAGAETGWIPLTAACVAPGTHTAQFRWDLPVDTPNTVQTDSVSFSLGIAADTSECV